MLRFVSFTIYVVFLGQPLVKCLQSSLYSSWGKLSWRALAELYSLPAALSAQLTVWCRIPEGTNKCVKFSVPSELGGSCWKCRKAVWLSTGSPSWFSGALYRTQQIQIGGNTSLVKHTYSTILFRSKPWLSPAALGVLLRLYSARSRKSLRIKFAFQLDESATAFDLKNPLLLLLIIKQ